MSCIIVHKKDKKTLKYVFKYELGLSYLFCEPKRTKEKKRRRFGMIVQHSFWETKVI